MATIPRTYLLTDKENLSNIQPKNGQVIAVWNSDEVWYDAPNDGTTSGVPVRRKISGVKVVTSLPTPENVSNYSSSATYDVNDYCIYNSQSYICISAITTAEAWNSSHWVTTSEERPMEDIVYVYIGNHGNLPSGKPFYDMRVWLGSGWYVTGNNTDDSCVKTTVSDDKFYLVGTSDIGAGLESQMLKNSKVYVEDGELYGALRGNADTATFAATATLATKAINDNATTPKAITGYLYGVSKTDLNPGTLLTFTKGDDNTATVQIPDTTYNVYTADPDVPGLVNGINTTVNSDSTDLLLSGSGWIDKDNVSVGSATSATNATNDALGQEIAPTYVAGAYYDYDAEELILIYGDTSESSQGIDIPITTYNVFDTSHDGLVPAASGSGDTGKFLMGNGTWVAGVLASDIFAGTDAGIVPASTQGDDEKFLRSDGTWFGIFDDDEDGLVPKTGAAATTDVLRANGTWAPESDTKNTAGATQADAAQVILPLYLIGAEAQTNNPQTYSESSVYMLNNKLYQSDGTSPVQVVDVSSSQSLTNKTYNGYTLGTACAVNTSSAVATSVSVQDTFTGDGTTVDFILTSAPIAVTEVTIGGTATTAYTLNAATKTITFTSAPADQSVIVVTYTVNDSGNVPTNNAVINYVSSQLSPVYTSLLSKLDDSVIAPAYDSTASYSTGDYCMYTDVNGTKLYECTANTTGDWDSNSWTETTLIAIIQSI